jgi:hypothetical protein
MHSWSASRHYLCNMHEETEDYFWFIYWHSINNIGYVAPKGTITSKTFDRKCHELLQHYFGVKE